jgi:hypothetical protein
MDFFQLIKLFRSGGSIWSKLSTICGIAAVFAAGADSNKTGTDDLAGSVLVTVGEGLDAYDKKEYNKVGNLIDAGIAGLIKLKSELIASGQIKPRAQQNDLGLTPEQIAALPPDVRKTLNL